jgi:hypothetical protein
MHTSASPRAVPTCGAHPRARAGWRCSACGRDLCPACAGEERIQNVPLVRCLACGGVAEPILVPVKIPSLPEALGRASLSWLSPLGLAVLMTLGFAMVTLLFLVGFVSFVRPLFYLGLFVYFGPLAAVFFTVLRRASTGETRLPGYGDLAEGGFLGPAARFMLASVTTWLPLYLYLHFRAPTFMLNPGAVLTDPFFLALLGIGFLYMPGALIAAGVAESPWHALNPLLVFGLITRAPGAFGLTLLAWIGLGIATFFWWKLLFAILFRSGSWWFLKLAAIHGLGLLPFLLGGFALGWFIHRNRAALTEGEQGSGALAPALPDARPTGSYDPSLFARPAAAAPRPVEPIELPPDDGPAARGEPGAGPPADPATALAAAVEAGDGARALDAYRRLTARGQKPALGQRLELRLGGMLERAGLALEAAHACHRAAQADLKGPLAPKAIFQAARLLCGPAERPAQGRTLYAYLVKNYPTTDFAQLAAEALRKLDAAGGR